MMVLIVEDEPAVLLGLADIVFNRGHEFMTARTLRHAWMRLACSFDVAILDVRLAEDNVFPFARELQRRHIPFGFITGLPEAIVEESGFEHHLVATKPPSEAAIAEMLQRLAEHVQR